MSNRSKAMLVTDAEIYDHAINKMIGAVACQRRQRADHPEKPEAAV